MFTSPGDENSLAWGSVEAQSGCYVFPWARDRWRVEMQMALGLQVNGYIPVYSVILLRGLLLLFFNTVLGGRSQMLT